MSGPKHSCCRFVCGHTKGELKETRQTDSYVKYSTLPSRKSEAIAYKVARKEASYPDGVLRLAEGTAPEVKASEWNIIRKHNNVLETVLQKVGAGKSCAVWGQPGTRKTFVLSR